MQIDTNSLTNLSFKIYENLEGILSIPKEALRGIVTNFLNEIFTNKLYIEIIEKEKIEDILTKENVLKIISFLKNNGLIEEEIRSIIINSPAILLFGLNIDNIYLIYKGGVCRGYLLLNNNKYRTYRILRNIQEDVTITGDMLNCDYIIEEMLESLERVDIRKTLEININDDLKTKFDKLSNIPSKKNYVFKK